MMENDPVLVRMKSLLDTWEATNDRRLIFLRCYEAMTKNILAAIEARDFEDVTWIATLMANFAELYFRAVEAEEGGLATVPTAWRIAFKAAGNPHTHALQNLVLGVNAHINYDLVLALSDLLASEWQRLSEEERQLRYRDHCHVNDIINHTIDTVKYQVIDPLEPEIRVVDKILGPVDDWMTGLLISDWREEVWKHAVQMIDATEQTDRQAIIQHVEHVSLERAEDILGKGNLTDLLNFV
jgi:hypothetical protein